MIRSNHSPSSLRLSRRDWLKLSAAGVVSYSMSGWLQALADVLWALLNSSEFILNH